MTKVVIKDLSDSVDLDREALSTIYGGSKLPSARAPLDKRRLLKSEPLFFPLGNKGRRR